MCWNPFSKESVTDNTRNYRKEKKKNRQVDYVNSIAGDAYIDETGLVTEE